MTKKLILILFALHVGVAMYSQNIDKEVSDLLRKFIMENTRFPGEAIINSNCGTIVGGLDFTNKEKPQVFIINPLNKYFNSEFERVMNLLALYFEINNADTLLFHIEFKMYNENYLVDMKNMPDDILEPIIIVGYGALSASAIQNGLPSMGEPVDYEERDLPKVEKYIEKGKYNKAISILTEMIQRNPYIVHFYELRSKCLLLTGDTISACQDRDKITNFLKKEDYKIEGLDCNN